MGYHKDNHFSNLDWALIAINSILLLFSWAHLIAWYPSLPEIIAVHFDVLGKPNGYSSKENIWIAPILFTLVSVAFIFGPTPVLGTGEASGSSRRSRCQPGRR